MKVGCGKLMKEQKERKIKIKESEYQILRRDRKAKKEIKALVLMLFDKVKNWK